MTYALTGDGKTVLKATTAMLVESGRASSQRTTTRTPRSEPPLRLDRPEQRQDLPGRREGRLTSSAGGVATQVIDPNLKDSYTNDRGVGRARGHSDFGCAPARVYRGSKPWQWRQPNRPFDAYTVRSPFRIQVLTAASAARTTGVPTRYNLSAAMRWRCPS
jgi:hypothetical protein